MGASVGRFVGVEWKSDQRFLVEVSIHRSPERGNGTFVGVLLPLRLPIIPFLRRTASGITKQKTRTITTAIYGISLKKKNGVSTTPAIGFGIGLTVEVEIRFRTRRCSSTVLTPHHWN